MTYSADRRQPTSGIAPSVAPRAGAASFVDQRSSTAMQWQLKQKIEGSQTGGASAIAQLMTEEEEPVQAKSADAAAAQLAGNEEVRPNNTGLPDKLKSGIENLSGMRMDHVKVHYNSAQPAQLNAHAYAQGSDIHVAPGQERHLPHEAWHVVQQAQGRVRPTLQIAGGVGVNDDAGLEAEADVIGGKAALGASHQVTQSRQVSSPGGTPVYSRVVAQLAMLTWENDRWSGGDASGKGKKPDRDGNFDGEQFDDVEGTFIKKSGIDESSSSSMKAASASEQEEKEERDDSGVTPIVVGVFSGQHEYGPGRNWADLHVVGETGGKAHPGDLLVYFQTVHDLMSKRFEASKVPGVLEWHPTGAVVTKQIVELLGGSLGAWVEWIKAKGEQQARRYQDKKTERQHNKLSGKISPEFVPEHLHFLKALRDKKGLSDHLEIRPVGLRIPQDVAEEIRSEKGKKLSAEKVEDMISPNMVSGTDRGNTALQSYADALTDAESEGPSLRIILDFRKLPDLMRKLQ